MAHLPFYILAAALVAVAAFLIVRMKRTSYETAENAISELSNIIKAGLDACTKGDIPEQVSVRLSEISIKAMELTASLHNGNRSMSDLTREAAEATPEAIQYARFALAARRYADETRKAIAQTRELMVQLAAALPDSDAPDVTSVDAALAKAEELLKGFHYQAALHLATVATIAVGDVLTDIRFQRSHKPDFAPQNIKITISLGEDDQQSGEESASKSD